MYIKTTLFASLNCME